MKTYLGTAFSPNMVAASENGFVGHVLNDLSGLPSEFVSVVGHEITARILSVKLNKEVKFN